MATIQRMGLTKRGARLLRPVHALGKGQTENGARQNFRQNLKGRASLGGFPQGQVFPLRRRRAGQILNAGGVLLGKAFRRPGVISFRVDRDLYRGAQEFLRLCRAVEPAPRERGPPIGGGWNRFAGAASRSAPTTSRSGCRRRGNNRACRARPEHVHPIPFRRRAGSGREFPRSQLPATAAR